MPDDLAVVELVATEDAPDDASADDEDIVIAADMDPDGAPLILPEGALPLMNPEPEGAPLPMAPEASGAVPLGAPLP